MKFLDERTSRTLGRKLRALLSSGRLILGGAALNRLPEIGDLEKKYGG